MNFRPFFYPFLISFLIIIGISLWFLSLNIPLYDDAGNVPAIGKYHDSLLANIVLSPHGLLNMLLFMVGMKLFGISTFGVRFTLFLISLAYMFVLFIFVRKALSKTTAWYAVLLHLFTFFAFFTYFIMETDGIINSFFSLLIFSSLYMYLTSGITSSPFPQHKKKFWLVLSLLSFALLVTMKYRTGLLIIPITIYIYYKSRQVLETIYYIALYLFCALFALGITVLLAYFTYGPLTGTLLSIIFAHNTTSFDFLYKITHPSLFVTLIVALSPIFLLLPFLSFKKYKSQYFLCYSWLSVCFLFLFLIPAGLSFVKYVAGFLLPPVTILTADILASSNLRKIHHLFIFYGTLLCSLTFIFINNTIPLDYWYFLTEMGPVIKVWQPFVYGTFFLCLFFFLLLWYLWSSENSRLKNLTFCFFLILAFSFNILLVTDNLVDQTHAQMIKEIVLYSETHKDLGRIYSWNEDIPFYLGNVGFYIVPETEQDFGLEFDDTNTLRSYSRLVGMGEQGYIDLSLPLNRIKEHILTEGGTVFLLNYPYKYTIAHPPSDDVLEKISFIDKTCVKELERTYKTATLLIYKCTGSS